jgi:hypothetical protein
MLGPPLHEGVTLPQQSLAPLEDGEQLTGHNGDDVDGIPLVESCDAAVFLQLGIGSA